MKLYTLLCFLLFPALAICQTDSLCFNLAVQKDSSLNFSTENVEFFNYLARQIDTRIESGFFPREKVIVRCLFSPDGKLDSIIPASSNVYLKQEVVNALNNIEKMNFPKEFDISQVELILIVERWKETGDFEIKGGIIATDKKNPTNMH